MLVFHLSLSGGLHIYGEVQSFTHHKHLEGFYGQLFTKMWYPTGVGFGRSDLANVDN